jgi:hypothetical protein
VLKDKSIKRKSGTGTTYSNSNNVAGAANYISVAIDSSLYIISNTMTSSGYTVQKLDATETSWIEMPSTPANVKSIAINKTGHLWVSTLNGEVFSHQGRSDWI